jgi:signal peptidase II
MGGVKPLKKPGVNLNVKRLVTDYFWLLFGAGLIVFLDQLSKGWVRNNLSLGEVYRPELWITPFARILHWSNTGSAFGLFPNMSGVFTVLAFLVSAAIIYYYPQVPGNDRLLRLAMILQLGGAVGNLVDRLIQGHVTDFLSVGNFPVFNVADASISTGVAVLVLGIFIKERQEKAASNRENNTPNSQITLSDPSSYNTDLDS